MHLIARAFISQEQRYFDAENNRLYAGFPISSRVQSLPAMLGVDERILPANAAHTTRAMEGSLVELGCYLGGSTHSILDGLAQDQPLSEPAMHSYD